MKDTKFDHQIEAAQGRLQDLLRRLDGDDLDGRKLAKVAVQELSNAMEELHVAHEELRQQNEELLAAREELEADRRRYQELFAFAPDGYLVTDASGIIREVNRAAARLLGVDRDRLTGKALSVYLAEEDQGAFYTRINRLRAEGEAPQEPWETRLQPLDDSPFHAAVTVGTIRGPGGELTGLRWLVREITARKEAEAEREALIEELDAFAHTVAHDLKRPLTLVLGYSSILAEDDGSMEPEERHRHLRAIAASGYQMSNIIEELLLLAGVRRKETVELMPVDMAYVVEEAKSRLAYLIERSEAEIVLPERWPPAVGYGPWVTEVWINYVSNAIQYGGAPPRVELGGERLRNGTARFWVRDNGPGLTEEEQSQLFTPFTRLHQVQIDGHGLGLSIVRRIVERLDGDVGVESEVGRGSVFTFTLPAGPPR